MVIGVVVLLFLVQGPLGLEPAVIALLGATVLLAWSGRPVEQTLDRVEWSVLAFFGGLFLVVGALVESGVIHTVAMAVIGAIGTQGEAILFVTWFSAIVSALVDNIPLTATMIPLIRDLGSVIRPGPALVGTLARCLPRRKRDGNWGVRERGRGRPGRGGRVPDHLPPVPAVRPRCDGRDGRGRVCAAGAPFRVNGPADRAILYIQPC